MCIAIVKPKFADFPSEQQFKNCFNTNPHGCGFMYSDGENLIIKKGFMTFEDFYNAFEKEKISKDKLVFFHFRIATHGLIDEGNTHPFPLTMNVSMQRQQELKFKGYGLIHNGVFHYDKTEFAIYDRSNVISDTMLLAMKIKENIDIRKEEFDSIESAIASYLYDKDKLTKELIDDCIGFNKIAIMNEQEDFVMFGKWIEDNGVFYSNDDYKYAYATYPYYTPTALDEEYDCCEICGNVLEEDKWYETTHGYICEECRNSFQFKKCMDCGVLIDDIDDNGTPYCSDCLSEQYHKELNKKIPDVYDGYDEWDDQYLHELADYSG